MTSLRAAVIVHSEVRGGAEKYLRVLYDDPRFDAQVLGFQPDWPDPVDLRLSPKWHSSRRRLAIGRALLPFERRRLRNALDAASFDYAHMQFKREQIGFSASIARDVPVVWTEHGLMSPDARRALGRDYSRASKHAALIVCVSQEVAAQVADITGHRNIQVIENSVDTEHHVVASPEARAAARATLGIGTHEKLAVWLGRMDEKKRPDLAARIGYGWDGRLLIAGDGPMRTSIESRDGVETLGHVDPHDLYRAADVLLMTSDGTGEGLPYVVLESAAYGVPVVASSASPLLGRLAGEAGGRAVDETSLDNWAAALDAAVNDAAGRQRARDWAVAHDTRSWRDKHHAAIAAIV